MVGKSNSDDRIARPNRHFPHHRRCAKSFLRPSRLQQCQIVDFVGGDDPQFGRCLSNKIALYIPDTIFDDMIVGDDLPFRADQKTGAADGGKSWRPGWLRRRLRRGFCSPEGNCRFGCCSGFLRGGGEIARGAAAAHAAHAVFDDRYEAVGRAQRKLKRVICALEDHQVRFAKLAHGRVGEHSRDQRLRGGRSSNADLRLTVERDVDRKCRSLGQIERLIAEAHQPDPINALRHGEDASVAVGLGGGAMRKRPGPFTGISAPLPRSDVYRSKWVIRVSMQHDRTNKDYRSNKTPIPRHIPPPDAGPYPTLDVELQIFAHSM